LVAESGTVDATAMQNIIFETAAVNGDSKWWTYSMDQSGASGVTKNTMGKIAKGASLKTVYNASGGFNHTHVGAADLTKYVPNFFR
jgi:hypothetical protein